jgi:hypothetical protein
LYGYQFAVAGELMRDYPGWDAADFADFQQWMLDVFWPRNLDFLTRHHDTYDDHYWANWDLCNLASTIAIAILCDRRDLYNFAVNYLQDIHPEVGLEIGNTNPSGAGNGNLFKAINYIHVTEDGEELGQNQESGRDQGHTTLNIGLIGVICQLTWNQGDDFYGFDDNRFLKCCEYVAKYNVAGLDVPFSTYTRWYGPRTSHASSETMTGVSPASRGTSRPIWSLPYYHYAKVKGVDPAKMKYTRLSVDATLPEWGPNMEGASGAYDQLGHGTLMYTR